LVFSINGKTTATTVSPSVYHVESGWDHLTTSHRRAEAGSTLSNSSYLPELKEKRLDYRDFRMQTAANVDV
jgi:hypothetical protein